MTAHSRQQRFAAAWVCAFCAGAATGVAALFKYQAALAGAAWLASLAMRKPRVHIAAGISGLAFGFAIVGIALVGGFARAGYLDAFLFWGWRYNFQYIAGVPVSHQII